MIKGVYAKDHNYLVDNLDDIDDWLHDPRITRRKNKSVIECFFKISTEQSMYQLYFNQKEYCSKNDLRISTKTTDLVHTKRLGYIVGACVKLASPMEYVKQINALTGLEEGMIEIKKNRTYEKGTSSKVLSIYAVEDEAEEVDNIIYNTKFKNMQYVSYRLSDSAQRLAAMHLNEMINVKSRFETLYETKLDDVVY